MIWILEAECSMYYDTPIWTFMAAFDSLEKAKAEAERVTPDLAWDDESYIETGVTFSWAGVEPHKRLLQMEAWQITPVEINGQCALKTWSDQARA